MTEWRMRPDVSSGKVLIGAMCLVLLVAAALAHTAWRVQGLTVATPILVGGTPLAPNLYGDPITTRETLEKKWSDELSKGSVTINEAMETIAGDDQRAPNDGGGGGQ